MDIEAQTAMIKDFRVHLLAAGRAYKTVALHLHNIKQVTGTYPDLSTVTLEQLEDFLAKRRRSHKPETRKSLRSSWRTFYQWAVKTGRLEHDPTDGLAPIFVPTTPGRIAPDEAVLKGLEMASLHEKAMILLGRLAGLRLSEITTLHVDNRQGDVLRVLGKGEKTRIVPLAPELAEVLDRIEGMQGRDYYFPGKFGGHVTTSYVSKHIKERTGVNPHSLRHAAATAAYRGTGDIRAVQVFLGHSNMATTQRYIHIDPSHLQAAAMATRIGGIDASPSARERVGTLGHG